MNKSLAPEGIKLGVVILAAGRSSRMGRPKLLLPWKATSVLGHLIEQWQSLGARQIAVVCAAEDEAMEAELDRLGFAQRDRVINPLPERGMFSSIRCAARWTGWKSDLTHWAIILGDQPHLLRTTLLQLLALAAAEPNKVCQPARGGKRRHPVLVPKAVFMNLATSSAANLKAFLVPIEVASFESEDAGLDLDIDRPEDYEQAQRLN